MHTWVLICSLALKPVECNLETADRWFEVANSRIEIRRAVTRLRLFEPKKQFIKTIKYGGSLGTSSYIYYPCDSPASNIDEAMNAESESERAYLRAQRSKGGCLR